jgi:hypothetical protein
MNDLTQRIQVLNGSLRCFVLGWFGLVPLLGLPFGVWALVVFWKTRRQAAGYRNPARAYLRSGLGLAIAGLLFSVVTTMTINLALYHAYLEGRVW